MSGELNKTSACFEASLEDGTNVAFISTISYPIPGKRTASKRIHRLVVLPDYQGIGIGTKVLDAIADWYLREINEHVYITTSAKNMIFSLAKNPRWSFGGYHFHTSHTTSLNDALKSRRRKCKVGGFRYEGEV